MTKFRKISLGIAAVIFAVGMSVQIIYPTNDNAQTKTNERAENISATLAADERIADYTKALAWLTGILALSTIGLWVVTWRVGVKQSRDTRTIERAFVFVKEISLRTHRYPSVPGTYGGVVVGPHSYLRTRACLGK